MFKFEICDHAYTLYNNKIVQCTVRSRLLVEHQPQHYYEGHEFGDERECYIVQLDGGLTMYCDRDELFDSKEACVEHLLRDI